MTPYAVKPAEAAVMVGVKTATFYTLMKADPRLRACVIEFPGVRGKKVVVARLQQYIEQLRAEQHPWAV